MQDSESVQWQDTLAVAGTWCLGHRALSEHGQRLPCCALAHRRSPACADHPGWCCRRTSLPLPAAPAAPAPCNACACLLFAAAVCAAAAEAGEAHSLTSSVSYVWTHTFVPAVAASRARPASAALAAGVVKRSGQEAALRKWVAALEAVAGPAEAAGPGGPHRHAAAPGAQLPAACGCVERIVHWSSTSKMLGGAELSIYVAGATGVAGCYQNWAGCYQSTSSPVAAGMALVLGLAWRVPAGPTGCSCLCVSVLAVVRQPRFRVAPFSQGT